MTLLERVSTLLRANVNEVLTKAEDPEKLARQLVLDMENQLMQVKTQVAIAIADQHLLQKKKAEQDEAHAQWRRKAELAVAKGQDDLARAALERGLTHERMAGNFGQQLADQAAETDTLRGAYSRLQTKLTETEHQLDLLSTRLRRSRAGAKAASARTLLEQGTAERSLKRLTGKADRAEAENAAARTMLAVATAESLDERFAEMEQSDAVEALLLELKEQRPRLAEGRD